ncbi:hypothetical protein LCGC14_1821970 [marine sediment metagenome]|uniref:Uncharacterized protein n=1 Tax=marine sediment metagenome TaxID=412755 RepID=A0A0F9JI54_9ZZZZ
MKALQKNYKFNYYSYFLKSSKYKKNFKLFLKEIEYQLAETESLLSKEEYLEDDKNINIDDQLNLFRYFIIYSNFSAVDISKRALTFENKDLYNIFSKIDKLAELNKLKMSERYKNTLLYEIKNIEVLIDQGQISNAKEKLNYILNLAEGRDGALTRGNNAQERIVNESNEIFNRVKDLLETCKIKERVIKEKVLKSKPSIIQKQNDVVKEESELLTEKIEMSHKEIKKNEHVNDFTNIMPFRKIQREKITQRRSFDVNDDVKIHEYIKKSNKPREKKYNDIKKEVSENSLVNIIAQVENLHDLGVFLEKSEAFVVQLFSYYWEDSRSKRATELIIQYFSSYFEINPFDLELHFIPYILDSKERLITTFKNANINKAGRLRVNPKFFRILPKLTDKTELKNLFEKFEKFNYDSLKDQYLIKISKEVKEYIFDVPVKNLYNFLIDFSKVIPLKDSDHLTKDSNENECKIKSYLGLLYFKIIEKEENKKIIYSYDFLKSDIQEKGTIYMDFIDLPSGRVKLIIKNEVHESLGNIKYLNWIGINLKSWIDQNIGKIVAKQVQTIFYEKSFDDLKMGNYKILQAKISTMGKSIENLKSKFFEVKAPLTLSSFNCSECGATINISSKEEKFIICEHCDTPFLMEWQKN